MSALITPREGLRLTQNQQELINAANQELSSGHWERLPSHWITMRWMSEEIPTPDYARKTSDGLRELWPGDTYRRLIFLNIIGGKSWSLLLDTQVCPWVKGRQGQRITFAKALEILADPQSIWGEKS